MAIEASYFTSHPSQISSYIRYFGRYVTKSIIVFVYKNIFFESYHNLPFAPWSKGFIGGLECRKFKLRHIIPPIYTKKGRSLFTMIPRVENFHKKVEIILEDMLASRTYFAIPSVTKGIIRSTHTITD